MSGSRNGSTTLLAWSASSPCSRSDHDLARAGVTADPDLCVETRLARIPVAGDHHDDPARVLAAGVVGRLDGILEQVIGIEVR